MQAYITMKKNLILIVAALFIAIGCSTEYEILASKENISLSSDVTEQVIERPITFKVINSNGFNLSPYSDFFVDGVKIEGNKFTADVVGVHTVTAVYGLVTSVPIQISFVAEPVINFRKRMLMEDYTGVWCGWCPRVAHAIELVHDQTEDGIAVAIHGPGSNPSDTGYDPYTFDTSAFEATAGLAPGYPKGYLNRNIQWAFPEPNNIDQAIALTQGTNPNLGLAMTSASLGSGNSINLDVNVMFGKDFTNDLKLVVYVLENGLVYNQHNYTSYYNGDDLLVGYVHNHVLRATLTPMTGEVINAADTKTENTYRRTFNASLPSNIANPNNIEIVAFVLDETGRVLNVRKTSLGETQSIEIL